MCPVEFTRELSALRKRRGKLGGGNLSAVLRGGNGADDETARRAVESNGEEDPMVGRGGDHRSHGPDDAAVAGTAGSRGVCGAGGSAQGKAERQAGAAGQGGGSAAAVPGGVFRFEHTAFPREAERRTRHRAELHVGAKSLARGWTGGPRQAARQASASARTPPPGGDAIAHRRQ